MQYHICYYLITFTDNENAKRYDYYIMDELLYPY